MLDRKLLRDLWRVKTQVLTIALVVASGIGGFIASLSTYDSLRSLQQDYYDQARFAHVFVTVKRAPSIIEARLLDIPGVAETETTIAYDVLLDLPDVVEPVTGHIIALPASGNPRVNRLTLMAGRWIAAPASNEVLVGEAFAKARGLQPGDRVAALLNGRREQLDIAGIVLSPEYIFAGRGGLADDKSFGIFWMGRERLAAAYNMEGAFNRAAVRLAHGASQQAALDALDRLLEPYGGTGAYGRDEQFSHRALTQEINEQKVFGIVLPSVFLAVAVFLLNVVVARQIGTQRNQIAALKALGYPNVAIGMHYLKFVLVIVALGIVLGIAIGAWLGSAMTGMYAKFFHFPTLEFRIQPWIPIVASVVSLAAAALGAFNALTRVVRLPPAEAMRPASPPIFRPTLLERLGYGHLYSPQVRMILRDMERRPLRALLTTLGISCAIAILISGTWWRDAIDYLLDVEFRLRERQHVSLVLTDPVSSSALQDVARLPGVLRAEAARDAPVRFRNGHLSYRTTLLGLPEDSQMRQLLDAQLNTVALPAEGIVMSERLARRLEVVPGDTVWIEFLQGKRAKKRVVVSGLVNELVELRAYMARDALNRLLGEGDSITSVRIQFDTSRREAFFSQVKQTPKIAAAVEIDPIIQNFRDTSARFILVYTGILTVFAAVIAVGVVYNNARIALAERAWELASLRVLGFTRGEVSGLLLGELAIELILALPLGWLLGYWLSFGIVQLIHSETFEIPLIIEPRTYAYATLATLAAGVISALIVRRRIDRMDLVAVLKTRE
ncbi:MAG: ABC transporter permease [Burkholderiales bacterium]|nr:ABC transporter permease [Burkholderiales bacterium]